MNIEIKTYRDLKEALKRLNGPELDQNIIVLDMDGNNVGITNIEALDQDHYVHKNDDDDGGTFSTLQDIHGVDFDITDYKISARKGSIILI